MHIYLLYSDYLSREDVNVLLMNDCVWVQWFNHLTGNTKFVGSDPTRYYLREQVFILFTSFLLTQMFKDGYPVGCESQCD